MDSIHPMVMAAVSLVTQALSDSELAAINLAAQLGRDPRGVDGYQKAQGLFTEAGGTQMHTDARRALAQIAIRRLS